MLCVGFFFACSTGDEVSNEEEANAIVATGLDLVFLNQNGKDILNPSTENHLSRDKMNLYYLVDGRKVLASEFVPDIGRHQGIMLIDETEPYSLRAFTMRNLKDVTSEKDGKKAELLLATLISAMVKQTQLKPIGCQKPDYLLILKSGIMEKS